MSYRIAEARAKKGWSQADLAKAVGSSQQVISRYESGVNEPKAEILKRLSKALGVTISYLLGVDDDPRIVRAAPSQSVLIPVVGRVAAGEPREAIEQHDCFYPWPAELLDGGAEYAWVQASGNSMDRDFPDKAMVLIKKGVEVRNGDIAAVYVNGDDITIKQIFFEDDVIRLHPRSHDPEYRDRIIDKNSPDAPEVRFFGRAVSFAAPLDWRP